MVDFLDRGGVSHLITKMLDTVYPVNSIYISLDSTSPASLYGGTWERFGKGQTLVGVNESDTDFSSAGKTGGEKTHKLTVNEMPNHNHGLHVGYQDGTQDTRYNVLWFITPSYNKAWWDDKRHINAVGGDQPHNNLQPYISVYMWKRIS